MATSIKWPSDLPAGEAVPVPLREGYGYQQRSPSLRTDFGLVTRARRIYSDAPAEIDVSWALNPEQWFRFEGFFWHELDAGTRWFLMPVKLAGVLEEREVNFMGEMPRFAGLGLESGSASARLVTRKGTQPAAVVYAGYFNENDILVIP